MESNESTQVNTASGASNPPVSDPQTVQDGQTPPNPAQSAPSGVKPSFEAETIGWVRGQLKENAVKSEAQSLAQGGTPNEAAPPRVTDDAIPDEFSDAATKAGFTDEEVVGFAKDRTNAELMELIPLMFSEPEAKDKPPEPVKEPEKPPAPEGSDAELDAFKAQLRDEIRAEVLREFGTKLSQVDKFANEAKGRAAQAVLTTANLAFDKASEEFSVFGKTAELPTFPAGALKGQLVPNSPAFKARSETFAVANALMRDGRSLSDAMEAAIGWWRGSRGQTEAKRNLIKDLKRNETRLSGPRTSKDVKKKYDNTRDELIDEIRQLQRAQGIDV